MSRPLSPEIDRAPASRASDEETIIGIGPDGERFPVAKLEAHRRNQRHEAISVFVFHKGRLLLQRRAAGKYHAAGLWANTCCSHPRWGETPEECARRRLREEVGISPPLAKVGEIDYAVPVGDLFENEHVHCFAGIGDAELDLSRRNALEADELAWRSLEEVEREIDRRPDVFAPWFALYVGRHRDLLERAERLCAARTGS